MKVEVCVAIAASQTQSIPKRRARFLTGENLAFYLFASPWLLGLIFFTLGPMIASFVLSFASYPVITPAKFIGFTNFINMWKDKLVWQSVKVTLLYSVAALPLILSCAFLVALMLNQDIRGTKALRTFYYMPTVISGVPVSVLWMWMLNPQFGLLNNFLLIFGIHGP